MTRQISKLIENIETFGRLRQRFRPGSQEGRHLSRAEADVKDCRQDKNAIPDDAKKRGRDSFPISPTPGKAVSRRN
jgi:hypothetical protein